MAIIDNGSNSVDSRFTCRIRLAATKLLRRPQHRADLFTIHHRPRWSMRATAHRHAISVMRRYASLNIGPMPIFHEMARVNRRHKEVIADS